MSKKIIRHPAADDAWRDLFKNSSVKVGFVISLSKSMLDMLCAVADDVTWDRAVYRTPHCPDNWLASELSLTKRGLIRRKSQDVILKESGRHLTPEQWELGIHHERSCCELTPAGEKIVELIKITGLFVEQDASINKRTRKKA